MMYLCDIFRLEANGCVCWLQTAPDFATAKVRIQDIGKNSSDDYLIYTQTTNKKVIFRVGPDADLLEIRAYRQGS